jgi:uncharacterized membrane protein YccC
VLRRGIAALLNGRLGRGVGAAAGSFMIASLTIGISGQFGASLGVATAIAVFTSFVISAVVTLTSWKRFVGRNLEFMRSPALRAGNWRAARTIPKGLRALAVSQHLRQVRVKDTVSTAPDAASEEVAIRRYLQSTTPARG